MDKIDGRQREPMRNVATEFAVSNGEEVTVKIIKQVAPPLAVSEENCASQGLGAPSDWLAFLRRWGISYRKNASLHVALLADVEAAIRAGAEHRPGPRKGTAPKTPLPCKDASTTELMERAGFQRAK